MMDRDDMRQIGLIALWGAAQTFDPSKGYEFATIAVRQIGDAIVNARRAMFAEKRGAGRIAPCEIPDTPDPSPGPLEVAIESERQARLRELCKRAMRGFSPYRRQVIRRRYVDGASWEEVAKEFGYKRALTAKGATLEDFRSFRHHHRRMISNAKEDLHCGAN